MHFTWHGNTCFKIQSKNAEIILDPPSAKTGLKEVKQKADIVTSSTEDKKLVDVKTPTNNPFILSHPGEFEIKGVMIEGVDVPHEKDGVIDARSTVFIMKDEDITVCHLGFLDRQLSQEELDKIGIVDVLLLPVGGNGSIGPSDAVKVMNAIEPRSVIPMFYKEGSTLDDVAMLKDFEKELSAESEEPQSKVIIKKKDFDPENTRIIRLKPQI